MKICPLSEAHSKFQILANNWYISKWGWHCAMAGYMLKQLEE